MHDEVLIPTTFIRHRRQLRALLLDGQPWFAARDLGRLLNHRIEDGVRRSLDVYVTRGITGRVPCRAWACSSAFK